MKLKRKIILCFLSVLICTSCLTNKSYAMSLNAQEKEEVFRITKQPESVKGAFGKKVLLQVEAEGNGLSYQWYYQKAGQDTWNASGKAEAKQAGFELELNTSNDGNRWKCIITNGSGKTLESEVVTTTIEKEEVFRITKQPESVKGAFGKKVLLQVEAEGNGLSYQWYYQKAGQDTWNASGKAEAKQAGFELELNTSNDGNRWKCIITNGSGKTLESEVVTTTIEKNIYTVTFDANGGYWDTSSVTTKSYEVTPGDKFTNYPSKPTHKTLTFKGWYYDKECKNEVGYAGFYPEKDMTVYAGWDEKVTVTFDANGGKVGNNKDTMQQVIAKGSTIENMPTATRGDSYSFAGWALTKNAAADEVIDFFHYAFDKDTYLYAVWTENYIITYDTNGGKWSSIEDTTYKFSVKPGESLGSPTYKVPSNPVCEGKAFTGWYHDKEGKNKLDNIYQYVPTSSETFYAGWTEDYYTITLIAKGGTAYADALSGETVKINVPKNQSINLRTTAVKNGYTFAGWSYDSDTKKVDFTANQLSYYLPSSNITLYAAFGKTAKVTLNANGGTFYNGKDTANIDLAIGYPCPYYYSDPTREGYYFAGWSRSKDATEVEISSLQTYVPWSETETLYAVWKTETGITAPTLEYDTKGHMLKITAVGAEKPYITIGIYKNGQLDNIITWGQVLSDTGSWYNLLYYTSDGGVYKFAVKASHKAGDADFTKGAVTYTDEYTYVVPEQKLTTPTNLHWEGKKATWNAVPYAKFYKVNIYTSDGSLASEGTAYESSCDTSWLRDDLRYQFTVTAMPYDADEYAMSDESAKSPVYGEETEELYNVTFHAGTGVTFEGMSQNTISWKQEKGSKIENTPNPVKSGYFLVGWALTENGKPIDLSTYTVESDVDLYAVMGKQIQPASITYNPYTKTVMISSSPSDHYYIALRITSESQGVVHEHYFGQVPESGSITYDVSEYVTDAATYTFKAFTDTSEEGAKQFGGVWSETQYTNDIVTTKLDTPTGLYWGMNAVANWSAVENADEYEVTLYKNGVKTDTVITTSELTADFYTEVVGEDDAYTFTVKAITSNTIKYLNSDVSEASSECRGRDENELPIAPTMAQPNEANSETEPTESDEQKELTEEEVNEEITDETAEDTENSENTENTDEEEQVDQEEKLQETEQEASDVNEADSPSDAEDSLEMDNPESESLEDGVQEE